MVGVWYLLRVGIARVWVGLGNGKLSLGRVSRWLRLKLLVVQHLLRHHDLFVLVDLLLLDGVISLRRLIGIVALFPLLLLLFFDLAVVGLLGFTNFVEELPGIIGVGSWD